MLAVLFLALGCAHQTTPSPAAHGTISSLSRVSGPVVLCEHGVPASVCTQCDASMEKLFKDAGDWCAEHARPESQCLICHPDLSFVPLPELHPDADFLWLSKDGRAVGPLADHVVAKKVTVFDFSAEWCAPCKAIDEHTIGILNSNDDVALRKLDVTAGWETEVARTYLTEVQSIPHVIVYGTDGKLVTAITGLDLDALDAAIEEGRNR